MRTVLIFALLIAGLSAPALARTDMQNCYYVADDSSNPGAAERASAFAFPWQVGQPPTDESRAVTSAFERTISDDITSIGASWLSEQTPNGRRYVRPNGIVVGWRPSDCETGLTRVRAYLQELEAIAPSAEVAAELAIFRQNARQVSRHEYDWANPPLPVPVERVAN